MSLAVLQKQMLALMDSQRPVHHVHSFFSPAASVAVAGPVSMEVNPEADASYATKFQAAYEKAVQAKRLDKTACVPPVLERFCSKHADKPFVQSATPWIRAQLDVCLVMLSNLAQVRSQCLLLYLLCLYSSAIAQPSWIAEVRSHHQS